MSSTISISEFIAGFSKLYPDLQHLQPWQITEKIEEIIYARIFELSGNSDYDISDGIAIHKSAVVEMPLVLKPPVIIDAYCFVGANAYLRGGVHLAENVKIGPGCEIKSSILMSECSTAHFNYVGNSLVGSHVNMEAGSVIANHYNERSNKMVSVAHHSEIIITGVEKFGALVGDRSKIGANAVLSPGTLLMPDSVVKRLELVEQVKSDQ